MPEKNPRRWSLPTCQSQVFRGIPRTPHSDRILLCRRRHPHMTNSRQLEQNKLSPKKKQGLLAAGRCVWMPPPPPWSAGRGFWWFSHPMWSPHYTYRHKYPTSRRGTAEQHGRGRAIVVLSGHSHNTSVFDRARLGRQQVSSASPGNRTEIDKRKIFNLLPKPQPEGFSGPFWTQSVADCCALFRRCALIISLSVASEGSSREEPNSRQRQSGRDLLIYLPFFCCCCWSLVVVVVCGYSSEVFHKSQDKFR